jgi:phenylpropionate dioxygenase-like ring-hydroxylating dioxygenase large terminal subunit
MDAGWTRLLESSQLLPAGPLERVSVPGLPMAVVAFRDANGRVGVFLEACPHVGRARASFARGSTEPDGLRCKFHGWKFDATGTCIDVPDLPRETDFRRFPRAQCLQARELDAAIWIFTG